MPRRARVVCPDCDFSRAAKPVRGAMHHTVILVDHALPPDGRPLEERTCPGSGRWIVL